jgi:flagellar biosynthesis protein FlhA
VNAQGELPAFLLDAALDRAVESTVEHGEWNSVASVAPETITDILTRVKRRVEKAESAALVTSSGTRYFLRQLLEASLPNLTVLSHNEIPPEIKVRSRGVIE